MGGRMIYKYRLDWTESYSREIEVDQEMTAEDLYNYMLDNDLMNKSTDYEGIEDYTETLLNEDEILEEEK